MCTKIPSSPLQFSSPSTSQHHSGVQLQKSPQPATSVQSPSSYAQVSGETANAEAIQGDSNSLPELDMTFEISPRINDDFPLSTSISNTLSDTVSNGLAYIPTFPHLPPSTAYDTNGLIACPTLETTVSTRPTLPLVRSAPPMVRARHTFHPSILNAIFTPTLVAAILPAHLHNLPLQLPSSHMASNSAVVSTRTNPKFPVEMENSNFLSYQSMPGSQLQPKSSQQSHSNVQQTQEERINERNRKGRERSLRTRRRNAFRLQMLERNVVYLTTENNLLKDLASALASLTKNQLTYTSHSCSTSPYPHPIVIPFTALLLSALSRPPPYIPSPERQLPPGFLMNQQTVSSYPPMLPISAVSLTNHTNHRVEQAATAIMEPNIKRETTEDNSTKALFQNMEHEANKDNIKPVEATSAGTMPLNSKTLEPFANLPDFKLSPEDFPLPSLDIEEIDRLLLETSPDFVPPEVPHITALNDDHQFDEHQNL